MSVFLFLLVRDSSLIARPLLNLLPRFLFLKRDADEPDATPTHIQYPVATPTTQHKSALLLSSSSCSRRACHRAAPPLPRLLRNTLSSAYWGSTAFQQVDRQDGHLENKGNHDNWPADRHESGHQFSLAW